MSFLSAIKNFVKHVGYILRDHDKRIAELEIRTASLYPKSSFINNSRQNVTPDYEVLREDGTLAFRTRHIWDDAYFSNSANNLGSGYVLKNIVIEVFDITGTTIIKTTTLTPTGAPSGTITQLG